MVAYGWVNLRSLLGHIRYRMAFKRDARKIRVDTATLAQIGLLGFYVLWGSLRHERENPEPELLPNSRQLMSCGGSEVSPA